MSNLKRSIALCSVLVTLTLSSCWHQSSPNVKVYFVDQSTGWIVGPRLLFTSDQGKNWTVLRTNGAGTSIVESLRDGLQSIQFLSASVAVQLRGDKFLESTDGGRSWQEVGPLPRHRPNGTFPQSVFFLSESEGWLFGEDIYHTTNRGRSWLRISSSPTGDPAKLQQMHVPSFYADTMPIVWFRDKSHGVMARMDGDVYLTCDAGVSWTLVARFSESVQGIFFFDNAVGWLVGRNGLVARTQTGGESWEASNVGQQVNLMSVVFTSVNTGCVAGDTILCTRDAGKTWMKSVVKGVQPQPPVTSLAFTTELNGWAVGGFIDPFYPSMYAPSSAILHTEDGGASWNTITP